MDSININDSLLFLLLKTLGEAKLASMNESKEFRKGIHMLAWQLKEMFMRAEDFQSAAQDLQLLRVTKDLQAYLSETDQRQSKQQEIATLEKTIESYREVSFSSNRNVLIDFIHYLRCVILGFSFLFFLNDPHHRIMIDHVFHVLKNPFWIEKMLHWAKDYKPYLPKTILITDRFWNVSVIKMYYAIQTYSLMRNRVTRIFMFLFCS